MNKSSNGCHFCKIKKKKTVHHLFHHCKLVENIWKFILGKINLFNLRIGQAELHNTKKIATFWNFL